MCVCVCVCLYKTCVLENVIYRDRLDKELSGGIHGLISGLWTCNNLAGSVYFVSFEHSKWTTFTAIIGWHQLSLFRWTLHCLPTSHFSFTCITSCTVEKQSIVSTNRVICLFYFQNCYIQGIRSVPENILHLGMNDAYNFNYQPTLYYKFFIYLYQLISDTFSVLIFRLKA